MANDQERAAFEAWATDNGEYPKAVERDSAGNYRLLKVHTDWIAWQAGRAALAAAPVQAVPEAELEALRKDAERYRWLRDNGTSEWGICVWGDDDQAWDQYMSAACVVDREIDAAMELHNQ